MNVDKLTRVLPEGLNWIVEQVGATSKEDFVLLCEALITSNVTYLENRAGNEHAMHFLAQVLGEMAPRSAAYKQRLAEWQSKHGVKTGPDEDDGLAQDVQVW